MLSSPRRRQPSSLQRPGSRLRGSDCEFFQNILMPICQEKRREPLQVRGVFFGSSHNLGNMLFDAGLAITC